MTLRKIIISLITMTQLVPIAERFGRTEVEHQHVCMYVCMYVRTYVCMYACMHVGMHESMCIEVLRGPSACMYVGYTRSTYANKSVIVSSAHIINDQIYFR